MLTVFKKNVFLELVQNVIYNIFYKFFIKTSISVFFSVNSINFNDIYNFYNKNKAFLLYKSDIIFKFLDKNIPSIKFDLTFLENMDINSIIKKLEQLCSNSYISLISNDIRKKVIVRLKDFISKISLLYTILVEILLDYSCFYSNIRIVRAPPYLLQFNNYNT